MQFDCTTKDGLEQIPQEFRGCAVYVDGKHIPQVWYCNTDDGAGKGYVYSYDLGTGDKVPLSSDVVPRPHPEAWDRGGVWSRTYRGKVEFKDPKTGEVINGT